jgi:hypothetical protein
VATCDQVSRKKSAVAFGHVVNNYSKAGVLNDDLLGKEKVYNIAVGRRVERLLNNRL